MDRKEIKGSLEGEQKEEEETLGVAVAKNADEEEERINIVFFVRRREVA